jgi:hypothetical protein
VKQGDLLGPVLFGYHVAAVMIAWRTCFKGTGPTSCTKFDDVLSGRATDTAVQRKHRPQRTDLDAISL